MPIYIVNYKYANEQAKLRSAQILVEAKDTKEARARAILKIREEYDKFLVGTIQAFTTSQ